MSIYKSSSLAMIPTAYKDGKLYSIRPVPEYGAELVTNGGFDTDSDWIKGTNWAISSGSLNATSATDKCEQNTSVTTNKTYLVSYNITNYVSGSVRIELSSGNVSVGATNSGNGFYSEEITALGDGYVLIDAMATFTGSIDNVSVKEVLKPSGDFTFSRGSNLAATRVDVNGLIEKGRENLLLQSNSFSTSPWSNNDASVTSGQADKDGGTNAWKWKVNSNSAYHYSVQSHTTTNSVCAYSIYAKADEYNFFRLEQGNNGQGAWFNLSSGTIGTTSANTIAKITSVGGGWYRCEISFVTAASSNFLMAFSASETLNYTGDNVSGGFIQDAQLEQGLVATDYIETGTSAAQSGILEDMPRLDYSGGASCPSLLLEPQRSNLVTQSEYFSASSWSGYVFGGASLTRTFGYESPEGNNNAYKFDVVVGTGGVLLTENITINPANPQTLSIWMKGENGGEKVMLALRNTGSAGASGDIMTLTSEWARYDVTLTTASANRGFQFRMLSSNGVVDQTIYVWGAQCEQGSYPTSYIPTYGTSQTRSADFSNNNDILGTAYSSNNFSYFIEFKLLQNSEISNSPMLFGGGSAGLGASGQCYLRIGLLGNNTLRLYGHGDTLMAEVVYAFTKDTNYKLLVKRSGTDVSFFVNGVQIGSTQTSSLDFTLRSVGWSYNAGTYNTYGDVKQFVGFETALTDSECIALTTL